MERDYLRWEAAEYEHKERSADWYWTIGIIVASSAITAIILSDFLFAIVLLLAGFSLAVFNTRKPALHRFELGERGLRINSTLYPYLTLKSFWVEDQHDFLPPRLLVTSQKPLTPRLVIPIPSNMDPRDIRQYLLPHLDEAEQHESVAHHIFDWLGL